MKAFETKYEGATSGYRKNALVLISLLLLILVTYCNSFRASWHLDDGQNITENSGAHLRDFSWPEVKKALFASPSSSKVPFMRPVSRFSFAVNYYYGGTDVFGYHLVNLSIHLVASFFLYLFLVNMFNLPTMRGRYGSTSHVIALLASTLWAVHPIQTQAVTYVIQRMASMAGMFYIMAMYFYVKAQLTPDRRTRFFLFAASAVAGLLSFGSKENAILIPASIFLFRLLFVQGFTSENLKKTLRDFSLGYLLPMLLALAIFSTSYDVLERVFALYEGRAFTLWERLLTESRVILLYISLLLYPLSSRFSIDHPIVISRSLIDPPTTLLWILVIVALISSAVILARRQPLVTFAILFFFLNHAAESTFLPMELVFEHRNYIPSMFVFVPIAAGILRLIILFSRNRRMQGFLAVSTILVVIVLGSATTIRNFAWRDERSLWTDCLEKYPSSFRAHLNLGRVHHLNGDRLKASESYERALSATGIQSPREIGVVYFNLGLLAHQSDEDERALSLYTKALEVDPCCPGANNNMAAVLLEDSFHHCRDALRLLDKAIECRRGTEVPLAWGNKAVLLWRMERVQEAFTAVHNAIEMSPDNPLNLLRLGYMLKETGELSEASIHFRRVLDLEPEEISAFLFLAEVHIRNAEPELAKSELKRLLQSVPREELIQYFSRHRAETGGMEIVPGLDLLRPLLLEIGLQELTSPEAFK
jgi:protein O-mannosyl-transferase